MEVKAHMDPCFTLIPGCLIMGVNSSFCGYLYVGLRSLNLLKLNIPGFPVPFLNR
jgi:hypothetical protein